MKRKSLLNFTSEETYIYLFRVTLPGVTLVWGEIVITQSERVWGDIIGVDFVEASLPGAR